VAKVCARARAVRAAAALVFVLACYQAAHASLSVTPVTWNVIGLDSNDVNSGPNMYLVGVYVCNTGATPVTNLTGTLVWDSNNIYINTSGQNPFAAGTLAAGGCTNVFFNVVITRTTAAYHTARAYHINITADGEPLYSTPTPRELYVEELVSQNRNSTQSISGPASVVVGRTYTYTVNAKTATGGYEQLESFLNFPNTMFQVLSISTTYTAPANATNNKIYADACGWDNNPLSASYRSCVGPSNYSGGKAGGDLVTTYTVRIVGGGAATLNSMIYDFSGSSYHYGNDYSAARGTLGVTALTPPNVPLVKAVSPNGTQRPGTDLVYAINYSNTGNLGAQQFVVSDPIPNDTDFKLASVTTTLGSGLTAVTVEYSADGLSWSTTPPAPAGTEPAGYNRNVRHVRWRFTGTLASGGSGVVGFTARIR
jgi:uncharacterized repeat protein (TIGR01451 family)